MSNEVRKKCTDGVAYQVKDVEMEAGGRKRTTLPVQAEFP